MSNVRRVYHGTERVVYHEPFTDRNWTISFDTETNELDMFVYNQYGDTLDHTEMTPSISGEDWFWLINGTHENGEEEQD